MLFIPPVGFAAILAGRKQIEAADRIVAEDGSLVVWPTAPAALWTAQIGNQRVRLNAKGEFFFASIPPGETTGILMHPTDSEIALTFPVRELTPGSVAAKSLVYPIAFDGACGMSEVEDEFCTGIAFPPRPLAKAKTESEKEEVRPKLGPEPTKVEVRERGSYPVGSDRICEDKNGFFSAFTPNLLGFEKYIK